MRLSNGFVIDKEKTFGELKFTAVRDVFLQNEDGTPSTQLKKRIYDQMCIRDRNRMVTLSWLNLDSYQLMIRDGGKKMVKYEELVDFIIRFQAYLLISPIQPSPLGK